MSNSTPELSTLQHLTSVSGGQTQVEHLTAALHTAAEHHTELAGHLRTRRVARPFNEPDPRISRDGAQMLADDHDRRAGTDTELADRVLIVDARPGTPPADADGPPLHCRDDQFIDDPAGARLRYPSCGAATELTLLPLAADVIVAPVVTAP